MAVTALQVQRVGAGAGDTASCQVVADAINTGGGAAVLKADYTANTVLAATTTATPVALTVAASRIVGRKASGNIAAMTGTETVALLPAATNAADGVATAAQITALEAATTALAKLKTGTVTIASGANNGTAAMGAATWDGKPVVVTLQASAGDGKIAAATPTARAVIAGGTLTVTLLDFDGVATNNASSGAQTWSYFTNAN